MPYVYVLCFHADGKPARFHHAKHYVGKATQLVRRIERHRQHRGARIIAALLEAGLDFEVSWTQRVATPREASILERKLKRPATKARLCPLCSGESLRIVLKDGRATIRQKRRRRQT